MNLGIAPMESFDRATVRELVEDHWRAKICIRGYGRRAKNTELMRQMTNQFADQMEGDAASAGKGIHGHMFRRDALDRR